MVKDGDELEGAAVGTAAPERRAEDSLRKRYFGKVAFNLVGLPLSWAVQAIAPRALGPADFGNFSFLTSFFTSVVNFVDAGTSTKLYNHLCQKPEDTGVLRFYWNFAAKFSGALLALVVTLMLVGLGARLWPEQPMICVVLGLLYSLAVWATNTGGRVMDAYGLTIRGELARLVYKATTLAVILALFVLGWLSLKLFLAVQVLLCGLLLWLWETTLRSREHRFFPKVTAGGESVNYGREFWRYSHPLLFAGIIATLEAIADRWLLQYFGSSVEQGFYGLSYQVSVLCFVFSGAAVPLLAREFNQAHYVGDVRRMADVFSVQVPRLFAVAALFSLFFASQARAVVAIFGGPRFADAAIPTVLMSLYPMHQTYGQLTASVFFAACETKLYRNIGLIGTALGLTMTYLVLAPQAIGGLQLGSTGLAIKMLAVQIVVVNVQLWFCTRILRLAYRRFLAHQLVIIVLLGAGAIVAKLAVASVPGGPWAGLALGWVVYLAIIGATVWTWPGAVRATRADLISHVVAGAAIVRRAWARWTGAR